MFNAAQKAGNRILKEIMVVKDRYDDIPKLRLRQKKKNPTELGGSGMLIFTKMAQVIRNLF